MFLSMENTGIRAYKKELLNRHNKYIYKFNLVKLSNFSLIILVVFTIFKSLCTLCFMLMIRETLFYIESTGRSQVVASVVVPVCFGPTLEIQNGRSH